MYNVRVQEAKIILPPTNYPHALGMRVEDPDGHVLRFGSGPPLEDELLALLLDMWWRHQTVCEIPAMGVDLLSVVHPDAPPPYLVVPVWHFAAIFDVVVRVSDRRTARVVYAASFHLA